MLRGQSLPCRNAKEKLLHNRLMSDILPQLELTVAARRKAEEKAALRDAIPKKRSTRLQVSAALPPLVGPDASWHQPCLLQTSVVALRSPLGLVAASDLQSAAEHSCMQSWAQKPQDDCSAAAMCGKDMGHTDLLLCFRQ